MQTYTEKFKHLTQSVNRCCLRMKDNVITDELLNIRNDINRFREQILSAPKSELKELKCKLKVTTRPKLANEIYSRFNEQLDYYATRK